MNTTEFLSIACAIVPDRRALIFGGLEFSFEELQQRVNRLSSSLSGLGVGAGDRVATMQVNCNQSIEIYFAAAQLDALYVPLNFRARAEELEQMLAIAQPSILFIGERYLPLMPTGVQTGSGELPANRIVLLDGRPDGPTSNEHLAYDDLQSQGNPEQVHFSEAGDDDTTVIMFTAGTTGVPKGVMLTHDSFSSYLLSTVAPADPDVAETNLLSVPFYHIAGLQAALAAIYGGRTLAIMRQFEPAEWLDLAQGQRVNRAMLVPTMLKQLMDHPRFREYDLSSLNVITYGAAPMPLPVIRQAIEEFPGARFINAFGQTETASTITMLPPEDHILEGTEQEVEKKLRRLTSIGKPLEDVEVMIVSEEGMPVGEGEVGEIVARGDRMMKGYWRQEAATGETLRSGWVYTGDLAYQDEDGYIYLEGRAKDFIKRGGEMIAPDEVEQTLMSHPLVEDAAVIGVPDLEWGEEVRALVVRKTSRTVAPGATADQDILETDLATELIEYCRPKLAGFKRPRSVVFVNSLPRNVMGKLLKRELREQYGYPMDSSS
jgi:acyl-CoA synthetase (AMP-forming)/AMP-acid ligase II